MEERCFTASHRSKRTHWSTVLIPWADLLHKICFHAGLLQQRQNVKSACVCSLLYIETRRQSLEIQHRENKTMQSSIACLQHVIYRTWHNVLCWHTATRLALAATPWHAVEHMTTCRVWWTSMTLQMPANTLRQCNSAHHFHGNATRSSKSFPRCWITSAKTYLWLEIWQSDCGIFELSVTSVKT